MKGEDFGPSYEHLKQEKILDLVVSSITADTVGLARQLMEGDWEITKIAVGCRAMTAATAMLIDVRVNEQSVLNDSGGVLVKTTPEKHDPMNSRRFINDGDRIQVDVDVTIGAPTVNDLTVAVWGRQRVK